MVRFVYVVLLSFHLPVRSRDRPLEDVQADYICVSVIKLPVSTLELTLAAIILGRSMTYDVLRKRLLFKILEL